jgi:hypothetical protein
MRLLVKRCTWIVLMMLLGACQVFNRPDTQATLRAENAIFAAEASAIPQTAQVEATQVHETVVAAETIIASGSSVNLQLMATARVLVPPTPARAGTTGGIGNPAGAAVSGVLQFVDTRTASSVRETDGCAVDSQSRFTSMSPQIYITTRALNITSGTQMGVEWFYQGEMIWSENFVVSQNSDSFCLWFYIDPQTVTFSPGGWTVRLYANGSAIEPELTFNITE